MTDPDPTVLEKLYHSGAWLCLGIVVAFFALRYASSRIAWLEQDHRAAIASALLGGLAVLVVPASQGTTPSIGMLVSAFGTVVALFTQPKPSLVGVPAPADVAAGTKPNGFIAPRLMLTIAAVGFVLIACGASARQKTIATTLHSLDVAEAAFVDFDGKHQMDIVNASTSLADGQAKLASYRKDRDKVGLAIVFAYRAVAAAAQLDDDPSVSSMIQAAALVAQELATLGVRP